MHSTTSKKSSLLMKSVAAIEAFVLVASMTGAPLTAFADNSNNNNNDQSQHESDGHENHDSHHEGEAGKGTIVIVKNTVGGDGTFSFTGDLNSFGITTVGGTGSKTFKHVAVGTYNVAETVPAGWDLSSAVCDNGSPITAISIAKPVHHEGDDSEVHGDGEDSAWPAVTCTFTNTKHGHLVVAKTTYPAADTTTFPIFASGTSPIAADGVGSVSGVATQDYEVSAGTYSVTEDLTSFPMWQGVSNDCTNVVVGAGETKNCTIVNQKAAHVEVDKTSNGGVGTFSFTGDLGAFNLTTVTAGTVASAFFDVFVGVNGSTLAVTETVPAHWSVDQGTCTLSGITPGATPVCSFVNTKQHSEDGDHEHDGTCDEGYHHHNDQEGGSCEHNDSGNHDHENGDGSCQEGYHHNDDSDHGACDSNDNHDGNDNGDNGGSPLATIVATKIVCANEADLPNWGAEGGPNITATTATDFLATHPSCHLQSGWNFDYVTHDVSNPGDNTGGTPASWSQFGPTNNSGVASVTVAPNALTWVREEVQSGFIPFMGVGGSDVSPEMYCNTDVLNYDNFDWISGLTANHTYYCVAWNVPTEVTPPTDVCTNLEGNQATIPAGYVAGEVVNTCDPVTPPVTDLCSNIADVQTVVPEGQVQNDDGTCSPAPTVDVQGTDLCPNLPGFQGAMPGGYHLVGGQCVGGEDGGGGGGFTFVSTGGGNGGGSVLGASTEAPMCSTPLLTKYLRIGKKNDPAEVIKLQNFLNGELGLSLSLSGIFDKATEAAVKAFQLKYADQVLAPWVPHGLPDSHTSTGYVYKTTQRWINLLYCSQLNIPLPDLSN